MSRSLSPTVGPATRSSPDRAESQVFVAHGIGITPFLAIARSHGSVNATLLQVGNPTLLRRGRRCRQRQRRAP